MLRLARPPHSASRPRASVVVRMRPSEEVQDSVVPPAVPAPGLQEPEYRRHGMTPLLQGAVDAVVPDDDAPGLVGAVRREVAEGALHPVEAAARLLAARELALRRLYCRDEEKDEEEGEERLPLDGAREGRHVVLDEEGVDEGDRDRAQERARHERAPVEDDHTTDLSNMSRV